MSSLLLSTYITAFILSLLLTAAILWRLIPRLSAHAAQPIYEGGPRWHKSKAGTPTLGGLAFLAAISVSLSIFAAFALAGGMRDAALSVITVGTFALLNAMIGLFDDLKKLRRKQNEGLKPWEKLILQGAAAAAFLVVRAWLFGDGTALVFSFGRLDLGVLYFPFSFLLILGIVNCANLTDGVDGLLGSVSFAVGVGLFYISALGATDVGIIAVSVMGAMIGFLFYNLNPARIFMGDTGSLYLGALAVGACFSLGNAAIVLPIGAVYVIEGVSVVLQVLVFKATGRRLFKMAPLHHHLEKCGMSENRICIVAMLLTLVLSLVAFLIYAR